LLDAGNPQYNGHWETIEISLFDLFF